MDRKARGLSELKRKEIRKIFIIASEKRGAGISSDRKKGREGMKVVNNGWNVERYIAL